LQKHWAFVLIKANQVGSKRSIKELFALFMLGGLLGLQLVASPGITSQCRESLFLQQRSSSTDILDFEKATKTASQRIEIEPTRKMKP
jgi:hypothetical protein